MATHLVPHLLPRLHDLRLSLHHVSLVWNPSSSSSSFSKSPLPPKTLTQSSRSWKTSSIKMVAKRNTDGATTTGDPEAELKRAPKKSETSTQTSTPLNSRRKRKTDSSSSSSKPSIENRQLKQENENANLRGDDGDFEFEHGYTMSRICDRLIEVFMNEKSKSEDWRRLLAFSREWKEIRPYFFKRCKSRAQQETENKRKGDFLTLSRKIKEVDDDMERHNKLLVYVKEHGPELDAVVARHRKDFTDDFFCHLKLLCEASYDRADHRDDLAMVAAKCLSAVEAHDRAGEDDMAITAAQKKFDDILNSPSLDAACKKIEVLAKRKELDSTLMLLITKAWAAAQDSNVMNEEVKNLMHHLYMVARGNLQRTVSKEVRIMQHLLSFEDPEERVAAVTDAFSPGDDLEKKNIDHLYTTPEKLHKWIKIVLDAYYTNKQSTVMESARQFMIPRVISRLQVIKETIEDQFL